MASIPPPPRAIGPYQLEELLGRGGMAEVWRARREGPGGFEKVVALKRILPSYARNVTLVQRFHEEARIAGGLTHGNIVPITDFGEADGEHYLVMEWVDGVPLSALLKTVAERGRSLPPEVVAHIISEAAAGLHHAHTRLDANGRPLNIVHRDVSPQNILLARQGDVKISDFGIAKAADSVVRTEAGIQIGKLCYMAPEQARGDPLDGRADLYSLGIVLWECLAMRPLFPREEGAEALKAVLEPKHVAPSEASPHAPAALDAVVLKALAPKREDRYPDAGSLARDLRVYVHSVSPGFGQADLAQFLERTLPFQGAPRVAPIPPTGQSPSQPPTKESGSAWPKPKDGEAAMAAVPIPPAAPPPPIVSSPVKLFVFAALLFILVLGGAGGAYFAMQRSAETPAMPPSQPAGPSTPPAQSPPLPQTGLVPTLTPNVTITPGPTTQIPIDVPKMSLQLRTEPTGASIVNDAEVIGTTPMDVQAPIGRPLKIALLLRGYEPRVFLDAPEAVPALASGSGSSPILLVPTTRTFGILWISMAEQAQTAQVVVDGSVIGETPMPVIVRFVAGTPVTQIDVDLPGNPRHRIDAKTVAVPWGFAEYSHNLARLGD